MTDKITGATLIGWGFKPGRWFKDALVQANKLRDLGAAESELKKAVATFAPGPTIPLRKPGEGPLFHENIRGDNFAEIDNIFSVYRHMDELMRVPTVVAGAVMPDACPSGSQPGTIPVGGVLAADNAIHPGWHSADICCSMAISVFAYDPDPTAILDAGMKHSHFGGGGRPYDKRWEPLHFTRRAFMDNKYLRFLTELMVEHFGTQGDGNHFFYVGRLKSTGQVALVTHHGSRKPGAMLYKLGMQVAEKFRKKLSPETPKHNAWIPYDTPEGREYWSALQTMRIWTKQNHYAIHDVVAASIGARVSDRFWNEHNFVFRRTDGLFYHAKGATPAYRGYAGDDVGVTLIPLNMAEPILITRGLDAPNGLGFAPHGAGRNFSRTQYMRENNTLLADQMMRDQTAGIDARFFSGIPDVSELPGAYKNAAQVRAQIEEYGLAEVVDEVLPFGCIMAGDWQQDAPWRKKRAAVSEDEQGDAP